jgi:predicted NodU family carbamoyl transferase
VNVLGISGFFNRPHDLIFEQVDRRFFHNAAASLMRDGVVVQAAEEERFDRIKHSNFFPSNAIRYCLDAESLNPAEVKYIAFFFDESFIDSELVSVALHDRNAPLCTAKEIILNLLEEEVGHRFAPEMLMFVPHHTAHAASTFAGSSFDNALVCVVDGNGESQGVSLMSGSVRDLTVLREYSRENSLGHFYSRVTEFLGFGPFDEYKVMGLAPYGDGSRYGSAFQDAVILGDAGGYALSGVDCLDGLLRRGLRPRRSGETLDRTHCDIAAAMQSILTKTVLHILRHGRDMSGHSRLCLSGGVAQNSSLNGEIARSGMFTDVFIDPASHDAGSAVGAAVAATKLRAREPVRGSWGVYLGPHIGTSSQVAEELEAWSDLLDVTQPKNPATVIAKDLAAGGTVGCARGRAEFGPRALGNRSILADPRPVDVRDHINRAVKLREAFRPLAPAVLEEDAETYFELPTSGTSLEFMGVVVRTRPEYRDLLGAVTHIDGSARVQVVRRSIAPQFADLLTEFRRATGVGVLLNTSFNNYAEPMVLTARDAIRCYLTSELDVLLLESFIVRRRENSSAKSRLHILVPAGGEVVESDGGSGRVQTVCRNRHTGASALLTEELGQLLRDAIKAGPQGVPLNGHRFADIRSLWEGRFIDVIPA